MSFSFLWSPQTHKTANGYYLNHDNLMIASPEDRKRLIFYFIGCQTPEKLNPLDRDAFLKEKEHKLEMKCMIYAGFWGIFGVTPHIKTKYNSRIFLNIALKVAGFSFCYYLGHTVTYGMLEPKFVNRSQLIKELSEKYSFGVFDFAQAKKESHLKALRNELTSESSNLLYN